MATNHDSDLARKLNLPTGTKAHIVAKPDDVDLSGLPSTDSPDADGVIVFVRTLAEVEAKSGRVVDAAKADRIAWLVYPKGGQLGTDLNRDILWKAMQEKGVRPVRQIAVDDTWSALRFRPGR